MQCQDRMKLSFTYLNDWFDLDWNKTNQALHWDKIEQVSALKLLSKIDMYDLLIPIKSFDSDLLTYVQYRWRNSPKNKK